MALKVGLVGLRGIGMTHANAYQKETLGKSPSVSVQLLGCLF